MITEKQKIGLITGKLIRVCGKCGCEVVYDEDLVTMGYTDESLNYDCACIVCDEDLDFWETKIIPKTEVTAFITNEDKEHYKKHGHLSDEKLDKIEEILGW